MSGARDAVVPMSDEELPDRRTFLGSGLALAASLGVAGCSQIGGTPTPSPTPTPTPEPELQAIEYGESAESYVSGDDATDPEWGNRSEAVTFEGERQDRLQITMRSDEFDPRLAVEDPDGRVVATDTDGATGSNSRVEMTVATDGTHTIYAATGAPEATGAYQLAVTKVGESLEGLDLRSIAYGETRESYLDEDNGETPEEESNAEPVTFEGSAGDGVEITMTSEEFDTLLVLADSDDEVLARNNDAAETVGGAATNSRLRTILPADGEYTIYAGRYPYADAETGVFELGLEKVGEYEVGDLREISYGETREGFVDTDDGEDPQYGLVAEPVSFEGSRGDALRIEISSEFMRPVGLVEDPTGEYVGTGVSRDDEPAVLEPVLAADGEHTIYVAAYQEGGTGPYTIELEKTGEVEIQEDIRSISYGERVRSRLDRSDPTDPERGSIAEPVTFEGSAGDDVVVSMSSGAIDTYLLLAGPGGNIVAEDDDGGTGLNSEIRTSLAEGGEYTIWAGSYGRDETGLYTLELQRA
jgi:hypothetical protein